MVGSVLVMQDIQAHKNTQAGVVACTHTRPGVCKQGDWASGSETRTGVDLAVHT
jgi:hypothetical protein